MQPEVATPRWKPLKMVRHLSKYKKSEGAQKIRSERLEKFLSLSKIMHWPFIELPMSYPISIVQDALDCGEILLTTVLRTLAVFLRGQQQFACKLIMNVASLPGASGLV